MVSVDHTIDIERQQNVLGPFDGEVARGTLLRHNMLFQINWYYRVMAMPIFSHLPDPFTVNLIKYPEPQESEAWTGVHARV